jgi:uncharacterized protein (DUF427 family)
VREQQRALPARYRLIEAHRLNPPVIDKDMTMGLARQQAPLSENPAGRFLLEQPLPAHILYAERAGRRMRVELAGAIVAHSDEVTLLQETGRYSSLLSDSDLRTGCPYKGFASYRDVTIDGRRHPGLFWYYHAPFREVSEIEGYLAPYKRAR